MSYFCYTYSFITYLIINLSELIYLFILVKRERDIMQTCPCNEDPLTSHFYIVKLGFTGVHIIFLFLL